MWSRRKEVSANTNLRSEALLSATKHGVKRDLPALYKASGNNNNNEGKVIPKPWAASESLR